MIFLSLGSNIGNKKENLDQAKSNLIINDIEIVKSSSYYTTEPWGNTNQDSFLNAVLEVKYADSAENLLETILKIEAKMGRIRKLKWEPRIIDIDILSFHNEIIQTTTLKLPHPFIAERLFVLEPWNEIAPNFVIPSIKKTIYELYTKLLAENQ